MFQNYSMDDERWYESLMREKALRDQLALESHYKNEYEKGIKKSREEGFKIGLKEGREEGHKIGLEEAREAGREEGIAIGEKRQLLVSIRGLMENGLSAEIIKRALKCSDEDISEAKNLRKADSVKS